jgi:hypothetical protein
MPKLPKHILKLLASCYGSWDDCNECCECELCIVCRTYSDYPIRDVIGRLMLREKQWMKKNKQISYRDCIEWCPVHESMDQVLNSEVECKKCVSHSYNINDDEEIWAMAIAAEVDLNICRKCIHTKKKKDQCVIGQYMDRWEGFMKLIKSENLPITKPSNVDDQLSEWCPFYLEHLVSKGKKK